MLVHKMLRRTSLALAMAFGLAACQQADDTPMTHSVEVPAQASGAQSIDPSGHASGAVAEMQSAVLEQQDTNAALTEAATAAVSMAAETDKK